MNKYFANKIKTFFCVQLNEKKLLVWELEQAVDIKE